MPSNEFCKALSFSEIFGIDCPDSSWNYFLLPVESAESIVHGVPRRLASQRASRVSEASSRKSGMSCLPWAFHQVHLNSTTPFHQRCMPVRVRGNRDTDLTFFSLSRSFSRLLSPPWPVKSYLCRAAFACYPMA